MSGGSLEATNANVVYSTGGKSTYNGSLISRSEGGYTITTVE